MSPSIVICSAISRRTSTAPTISARPGRASPMARTASPPMSRRAWCAKIPIAPDCSTPEPNSACTFRSTTARHWQSFQLNLPATPVTDIKLAHNDLVLSTQGRSFWILDNLTPLHQIKETSAAEAALLFTPREAVRTAGARRRTRRRRFSIRSRARRSITTSGNAPSAISNWKSSTRAGKAIRKFHQRECRGRGRGSRGLAPPSDDEEGGGGGGRGGRGATSASIRRRHAPLHLGSALSRPVAKRDAPGRSERTGRRARQIFGAPDRRRRGPPRSRSR